MVGGVAGWRAEISGGFMTRCPWGTIRDRISRAMGNGCDDLYSPGDLGKMAETGSEQNSLTRDVH